MVFKHSILPTELGVGVDVLIGTNEGTKQRQAGQRDGHWVNRATCQLYVFPPPSGAGGLCLYRLEDRREAIQGQKERTGLGRSCSWALISLPPNLKPDRSVLPGRKDCGRWATGLWPTHRLLETLLVRAVTEARDTESGSSPSPRRMAKWSRSSISSTAGSSGEEDG